jgi:hypothetical protein
MARSVAARIDLPNKPRRGFEAIVRQHSAPQCLVTRTRIILLGAADAGVRETTEQLGLACATVQRWPAHRQVSGPAGLRVSGRRTASGNSGDVHARANLRDYLAALREPARRRLAHRAPNTRHRGHHARHRSENLRPRNRSLPARGRSQTASHLRLDQQPTRCANSDHFWNCMGFLGHVQTPGDDSYSASVRPPVAQNMSPRTLVYNQVRFCCATG